MKRDLLIEFWMANGFLPSRGQADPYSVGCEIFNDLVWRSFFQDVEEDSEGVMNCKMHDLMHDLTQFVTGDECSIIEGHKVLIIPEEVHHLCFASTASLDMIPWTEYMHKVKSLRTLVFTKDPFVIMKNFSLKHALSLCISRQRDIRVLNWNLSRSLYQKQRIPKSIGNLKHLRYLDLSFSSIKSLPESACCLQNLQTLKLTGCEYLRKLPEGMKYMRNLQNLDLRRCYSLSCMPHGMGQITCLQKLSQFLLDQGRGCRIGELKELNLRGELSIGRLDYVRDFAEAKSANFKCKEKLVSLSLWWWNHYMPGNAEEVLEGLEPHSNLKMLELNNYQGSRLPNWMFGLVLQNLVELSLINCERCEDVPSLGKLLFLRVLVFDEMGAVKSLNNLNGDGEISFPALEELVLRGMTNLVEWKTATTSTFRGGESFPCLRHLRIIHCPMLTELPPHLPRLELLKLQYSNVMLVGQVMSLTSISSLEIRGIDEFVVLPNELDNLTALEYLNIRLCPCLESLTEKGLKNLKSLQRLELIDCDSLKSLSANGPMLGLSSLRILSVSHCKNMECLTEGVQDGLQSLSTLEQLHIAYCPKLERRCKKDTGEDWPKISHIPTIQINYQYVQDLGN